MLKSPYLNAGVKALLTDRDVAVSSAAFDRELMSKYGIRHVYLPIRNKANSAEVCLWTC